MKKILFRFVGLFLCIIFACSSCKGVIACSQNESKIYSTENKEIIDSGKYYRIYKKDTTRIYYEIYNSNGEIVGSETTDRPLIIDMLTDNIVDISIGMGTGLTIHKYYNIEKDLFSQDFSYVLATLNELVAYIDIPKEKPFENRKIVVRNAFDQNLFYKVFPLDFSPIDTPVTQAAFSKDGTSLQLTYLSGKDQREVSESLKLD